MLAILCLIGSIVVGVVSAITYTSIYKNVWIEKAVQEREKEKIKGKAGEGKKLPSFFDPDSFIDYNSAEVRRLRGLLVNIEYNSFKRSELRRFIDQYDAFSKKSLLLKQELDRCFQEDSLTYNKFVAPVDEVSKNFSANLAKVANSFIADVYIDTDEIRKENSKYIDGVDRFLQTLIELNLGTSLKGQDKVINELLELVQQLSYYKQISLSKKEGLRPLFFCCQNFFYMI